MSEAVFSRWHGIENADPTMLWNLYQEAERRGWDADAIAGIMSSESGFSPSVKNPYPGQTATGLIQMIEQSANAIGTTTADLARMTAVEQLPWVLKYYEHFGRGRQLEGSDFFRLGWGNDAANFSLPTSTVLAPMGSDLWELNKAYSRGGDITIQTLIDIYNSKLRAAQKRGRIRIKMPPTAAPAAPPRESRGSPGGGGELILGLIVLVLGTLAIARKRQRA